MSINILLSVWIGYFQVQLQTIVSSSQNYDKVFLKLLKLEKTKTAYPFGQIIFFKSTNIHVPKYHLYHIAYRSHTKFDA